MNLACQVGTVKGHSVSIMVSGVFSWNCLMRVTTYLIAIRYAELLRFHLHSFMLLYYLHGNGVFQQNNCISHKSRLTTGRLDEHPSDCFVINGPPRSPELNPIEYLWNVWKRPSYIINEKLN
ncbi:transposable element Tcb2 transposase [Trichonephila clavipes]|nr:transposable element Tcb2 transposase [Trichonephila clavipes]